MAFLVMMAGCVVKKPDSTSISQPDYNMRQTVAGAKYKKKMSGLGIGITIGSAAAGAYLGYTMNMITYQDGESTVAVKPANAVIGAALGFSIAALGNHIMGLNKSVQVTNPNVWIRKANNNYLLLDNINNSDFTVINNRIESRYSVKNFQDVIDFNIVFSGSIYSEDVVQKGIDIASRSELLQLLEMYPYTKHKEKIQFRYIDKSNSVVDLLESTRRFPHIVYNSEEKCLSLISSLNDVDKYLQSFPNGDLKKDVEQKAVGYVNSIDRLKQFDKLFPASIYLEDLIEKLALTLDRVNLPSLIESYPTSSFVSMIQEQYIKKSLSFSDFYLALEKYPNTRIGSPKDYEILNTTQANDVCTRISGNSQAIGQDIILPKIQTTG